MLILCQELTDYMQMKYHQKEGCLVFNMQMKYHQKEGCLVFNLQIINSYKNIFTL